jgi:hypothetical protein
MKKYLFFFVTLFFTSCLVSSDNSTNICLESCIVIASAKIVHSSGYCAHQSCTHNFNNQSRFDRACAHSTGIIWTAYCCNFLTAGTPFPTILLGAPVIIHNVAKGLQLPQMR